MAERIVVDANLAVALVLPLTYSETVARQWQVWQADRAELYAPELWEYEVVSALRKAKFVGLIDAQRMRNMLGQMLSLGVACIPADSALHLAALDWSERLGQPVAYDGQYLALAESLGATFWTADKRMFDSQRGARLPWLHWVGEVSESG